jgi:hypothetical protein
MYHIRMRSCQYILNTVLKAYVIAVVGETFDAGIRIGVGVNPSFCIFSTSLLCPETGRSIPRFREVGVVKG